MEAEHIKSCTFWFPVFVLAILYILKNYRAPMNNLNPMLVKLLFIYFLGLQSNISWQTLNSEA